MWWQYILRISQMVVGSFSWAVFFVATFLRFSPNCLATMILVLPQLEWMLEEQERFAAFEEKKRKFEAIKTLLGDRLPPGAPLPDDLRIMEVPLNREEREAKARECGCPACQAILAVGSILDKASAAAPDAHPQPPSPQSPVVRVRRNPVQNPSAKPKDQPEQASD